MFMKGSSCALTNLVPSAPAACHLLEALAQGSSSLIGVGIPSVRSDIRAEAGCWEGAHHLRIVEVQPNLRSDTAKA